jgi:hypothetical protein
MRKGIGKTKTKDVFYSDGHGGTSANGTQRCDEDGNLEMPELIGDEAFMEWRERGDVINLKAKDHQWELGSWIVEGETMKEIAGEVVDQRFKHSVYAAAADITGYSINSIKGFANVVRNIPEQIRDEFPTLSIAHLKLVAKYHGDPEKQRNRLSEMLMGDLKVSQARERLRLLDNEIRKPKSKPDRHASRVISHLDHVLAELENLNLMAATSTVQGDVLKKVQETRRVLKDLESDLIPAGQVE